MKFHNERFEIEIVDESANGNLSTDKIRKYFKEFILDEARFNTQCFGIIIKNASGIQNSCSVLAKSWGKEIDENTVVFFSENLYISIGNKVCCFAIPSLILQWQKEVDLSDCFGLYISPDGKGIISHGEMDISKLSFSGEILWQVSGKDIFTEGFEILNDHVEVIDFNHEKYRIDLSDGQISLI
jgi:hypothetical protein